MFGAGGFRRHYRVSVHTAPDRPQINLAVKVAEVRRDFLARLGVSSLYRNPTAGTRVGTGQFNTDAPFTGGTAGGNQNGGITLPPGTPFTTVLSDFGIRNFLSLIEAEEQRGRARTLAEPNLTAANRDSASFLAGGEVPIPVPQPGQGGQVFVTIVYREFGVRLNFTPEVLSDSTIKLRVRPEVSELDFSNAVTLSGFRIPALRTRRIETSVDVPRDRSFIISGCSTTSGSRCVRASRSHEHPDSREPVLEHAVAAERVRAHRDRDADRHHPAPPTSGRRNPPAARYDAAGPRGDPAPAARQPAGTSPVALDHLQRFHDATQGCRRRRRRRRRPRGGRGPRAIRLRSRRARPDVVGRAAARAREPRRSGMLPVEGDGVDFDVLASQIARGQTLVVGTASTPAPDLILRAMRAGVHEFLLSPINGAEFASAVERLMRRMQSDTGDRLLVAVHSPKGGLGTTSVAINLAHQFAARTPGGKAGLADFVVGGGDVGVMLNLRPTFDVGDLALKIDQLDAALLDSVLVNAPGGVRVLAASDRPETAEHVDAQAAVAILGQMRAGFFYTVVDCEHHLSDRTLAAMDAADRVVLVTQLNVAALRSTQRAITVCRRLGFGEDKLVVVANRISRPT
jgi:Flp pilus assembly CpaE family ATPase